MIKKLLYTLLILIPLKNFGQSAYYDVREGNQEYKNNIFIAAENRYRESISKESDLLESNYNLGNTLYRQGKYEEASKYYQNAAAKAEDKVNKSKAYHNLGNALVKNEKFEDGIEAYKNALINNPQDEDSRYNLAYAKQMLQQQQEQEQQQDKQDENKEEQEQEEQEEQNQDDQEEKEEEQEQEQEREQQNEEEEEQQQPQEQKEQEMSREDAERILEALNNKEKEVQEKLKKKKGKDIDVNIEKDW